MFNKMFSIAPPNFGQTRNYSTNISPRKPIEDTMKMYLNRNAVTPANAYLNNFQGFSSNKTFDNIKETIPSGKIYQSCSNFINKTNSYPNNLRKEHIQSEEATMPKVDSLKGLPTDVYPAIMKRVIDISIGGGFEVVGGKIETPKSTSFNITLKQETPSKLIPNTLFRNVTNGKVETKGQKHPKNQNLEKVNDKINHHKVNSSEEKKLQPDKIGNSCINVENSPQDDKKRPRKLYNLISISKHSESFPPMEYHPSKLENTKIVRTKDTKKKKQRRVWHKSRLDFDYDLDVEVEVGIEASDYLEPPQRKPTLQEFITKSTPIQCQPQTSTCFLNDFGPICFEFSSPVYFSVSPPRPAFYPKNISPRKCIFRNRLPSDCPSEDSISIIFDDADTTSCTEDSDEYSDDSDYTEDESEDVVDFVIDFDEFITKKPKTKVRFNDKVTVHPMITWAYAYRTSRKGHWEEFVRDRERFKKRIEDSGRTLDRVLESQHRDRIYKDRFQKHEDCMQAQ